MAKKKSEQIISFKKGEKTHLDYIYNIQALCGGDWWERPTDNFCDDNIVITRDIKIVITEYSK